MRQNLAEMVSRRLMSVPYALKALVRGSPLAWVQVQGQAEQPRVLPCHAHRRNPLILAAPSILPQLAQVNFRYQAITRFDCCSVSVTAMLRQQSAW
jgi:hypothetical protein